MPSQSQPSTADRASVLRLFALASWESLEETTRDVADVEHVVLRGPETGLVMLRGRMGSTGGAFNLGEATVTRCSLRLANGVEGHGYVLGRNGAQAHRIALCDALFQEEPQKLAPALAALEAGLARARQDMAAKAAATKVDFFTMVRGDD